MKLFNKLKDFKNRLTDRHMYTVVSLVLVFVVLWGVYENRRANDYALHLNNQYNRMFFDMTNNINNVEALLAKALISSSPNKTSETLQEAWGQASLAQANIIQLPIAQQYLDNTSKFLTQVGDLAYTLNLQTSKGEAIAPKQYETIKLLYNYASDVNENVKSMQNRIFSGKIKWHAVEKEGKKYFKSNAQNLPSDAFADINKTFQDYPTLIYDGPFSDHITQIDPVALGDKEITKKQAKEVVKKFYGEKRIKDIQYTGGIEGQKVDTYTFAITFNDRDEKDRGVIEITRKGGYPYYALSTRPIQKANIDIKKAKKIGGDFLKNMGFKNMKDTYFTVKGNVATVNYAGIQDKYILYPDLVKLQIALDNGEILGIESKGYLYSHKKREIPEPKLTMEEAKEKISDRVEITDQGYAVIPTQYKSEKFVYEFKGSLEDRDCLIYIGTVTGEEEEILLIINSDQGVLTMDAHHIIKKRLR